MSTLLKEFKAYCELYWELVPEGDPRLIDYYQIHDRNKWWKLAVEMKQNCVDGPDFERVWDCEKGFLERAARHKSDG